jgi:hypothetical protein
MDSDEVKKSPSSGTMPIVREAPVTLVVEEWRGVQPGRLAWVFPDLATALEAAHAMRNAARWVILAGRSSDVMQARDDGTVLAESSAA